MIAVRIVKNTFEFSVFMFFDYKCSSMNSLIDKYFHNLNFQWSSELIAEIEPITVFLLHFWNWIEIYQTYGHINGGRSKKTFPSRLVVRKLWSLQSTKVRLFSSNVSRLWIKNLICGIKRRDIQILYHGEFLKTCQFTMKHQFIKNWTCVKRHNKCSKWK